MPSAVASSNRFASLKKAIRISEQIDKLQKELAALLAQAAVAETNEYTLGPTEMKKAARNLHARAEKKIAEGRAKEFTGDLEAIL